MAKLKSGTRIYGDATIDNQLTVGTINKVTVTSPATSATLTLAQGSTLATSGAFSTTLTATGTTNVTLPASGTLATTAGTLSSATNSTQSGYFGDIFLYDDSTPSHYLGITNSANLTAARTLSINVNDADRTISLSGNLTVSNAATISGSNTGDQTIALTGDVTGSGTGSFAATIAADAVTFAKMQNSAAAGLSVVGRSSNSAGDFAEIAAGTDGHVLYRASSTSLAFGQLPTASIANDAITYAKIQNVSATDRLLGRSSAGAGDIEEITCTAAGRALLDDADAAAQRTTLGLGTIATQASNNVSITGGSILGLSSLSIGATAAQNTVVHLRSDANSAVTHLYLMNRTAGANVESRIAFTTSANDLSDNRHAYIGAITTGATENGNHFVIATNPNGAEALERIRIASTGAIGLSGANYGNSGQVLTSNGPNAAPTWQAGGASIDPVEVMLFG